MKRYVFVNILLVIGLFLHPLTFSDTVPNPFLRPGTKNLPPVPKQTFKSAPPPKDFSKELEFRGYYMLKGKPYFCLFNKKSNHGEWVALSDSTYEEFQVHQFDLDSEKLTVLYEGVEFDLSLLHGGSGSPVGNQSATLNSSSTQAPSNPTNVPSVNTSSRNNNGTPRYMPPRPSKTPTLPSWLVNRGPAPLGDRSDTVSSSINNYSGIVPRRVVTNSVIGSSSNQANSGISTPNLKPSISNTFNLINNSDNGANVSFPPTDSNGITQDPSSTSSDFDLDSLPPPPPPPNITPPTPPPNILPSREN